MCVSIIYPGGLAGAAAKIEVKRGEVEKECDIDEVMFCQKLEEKRKEGIEGRWEMGIGMGSDLGILFTREYI